MHIYISMLLDAFECADKCAKHSIYTVLHVCTNIHTYRETARYRTANGAAALHPFFSWNRRIHEKTRRAPLKEEARFQAQRQAAMLNRKLQNCILDANPKRKLRIINDNTNIWEIFTKKKAVALPPTRGRVGVI